MKLENIIKHGKKAIAVGLTSALLGFNTYCGDSGNNRDPCCEIPTNRPPIISSYSRTSPTYQSNGIFITGEDIIYNANITDPDNNLSGALLETKKTGETNYTTWVMTNPSGDTYKATVPIDDGTIIEARIKALDTEGLENTSTAYNDTVKVSESDAQLLIKNTIDTHNFKSFPTSVLPDQLESLFPFTNLLACFGGGVEPCEVPVDISVKFSGDIEYTWPDSTKGSGNEAVIFINYINPLNSQDKIDAITPDPFNQDLSTYKFYLDTGDYFNRTDGGVPSLFIESVQPDGITPLNKTDIEGIVISTLNAEDIYVNYKPVAQTFTSITLNPFTEYTFDFVNNIIYNWDLTVLVSSDPDSYDPDNEIIDNYCIDWGDGSPQECSIDGIFPSKAYSSIFNWTGALWVIDDEGAQSNISPIDINITN